MLPTFLYWMANKIIDLIDKVGSIKSELVKLTVFCKILEGSIYCIRDYLLNGMVQVSEWNCNPTSLEIMTLRSENASVNLRVT